MRKRAAAILALLVFSLVAMAGWLVAYGLSGGCYDGRDSEGHWVGGCYHELGPLGYIIPLLLGAVIAVYIRRRGKK